MKASQLTSKRLDSSEWIEEAKIAKPKMCSWVLWIKPWDNSLERSRQKLAEEEEKELELCFILQTMILCMLMGVNIQQNPQIMNITPHFISTSY